MLDDLQDFLAISSGFSLLITALDVLIVFYLIYRVLLLIKGTKAVQMLTGLIAIIIFFFASKEEYLNLPTLNWLLDKFISSFILIIIVVFQDDIRRGLSQVGRTSFITLSAREETQVIEEVVKGSVMLAERKLGALIAIQREADLTPYTAEAITIQARVTKELLFSVFLPNHQNPLHDGAAIIQKDKLVAAGCFLPLTKSPKVEQSLGTRHRAGIGLSEEADAAVVIVSEETGTISVAFRGKLIRGLDASRLRDVLHWIFAYPNSSQAPRPENESIIHWLRNNLQRPSTTKTALRLDPSTASTPSEALLTSVHPPTKLESAVSSDKLTKRRSFLNRVRASTPFLTAIARPEDEADAPAKGAPEADNASEGRTPPRVTAPLAPIKRTRPASTDTPTPLDARKTVPLSAIRPSKPPKEPREERITEDLIAPTPDEAEADAQARPDAASEAAAEATPAQPDEAAAETEAKVAKVAEPEADAAEDSSAEAPTDEPDAESASDAGADEEEAGEAEAERADEDVAPEADRAETDDDAQGDDAPDDAPPADASEEAPAVDVDAKDDAAETPEAVAVAEGVSP